MLRTLLLSMLFATGSMTAMADDFQYLTVAQSGGDTSFTVSNIQRITFDASNMVLHLSDNTTQTIPLSGLQKMFFSSSPTSISAMTMQSSSKIHFEGGVLRADIADDEALAIYDMKGRQVFSTHESGTYDLSAFTRGVYIIKVGTETRKVVNK